MSLDGWIPINKPEGWTSHDVVAKARNVLKERKIGHTGTLDPLATGLLVLLTGKWTRLSRYVTEYDKEYEGSVFLGKQTDSGDRDGDIVAEAEVPKVTEANLAALKDATLGTLELPPPAKSAKKVRGVPAYVRVRRDEEVKLEPVPMTIHEADFRVGTEPHLLNFRIRCSKGTYLRSLAPWWAEQLGTVGHIHTLHRTQVGGIRVEEAGPPDNPPSPTGDFARLMNLPHVELSREEARAFLSGNLVTRALLESVDSLAWVTYREEDETMNLGVGCWQPRGLQPKTVIGNSEEFFSRF